MKNFRRNIINNNHFCGFIENLQKKQDEIRRLVFIVNKELYL